MADYPGSIPAKPTINTADMSAATAHTVDRGKLWDELRAFMQEVGTTPSGAYSTLKARVEDSVQKTGTQTMEGPLTVTDGVSSTSVVPSGVILPAGQPTNADRAARKDYIDAADALLMPKTGGAFSGQVSCTVAAPVSASHLTRKDYVDGKASLGGDTFTGQINGTTASFSGNVSADTATGASHLMRKDQTDTALALKANLSGASFSGAISATSATFSSNVGLTSGHVELDEISDPVAPAANKGRLYVRDSGGKSQLVVRFPTGAIQILATEP